MGDTPANYGVRNAAQAAASADVVQKKLTKKKTVAKVIEVLPPTENEKKMASAYGGSAVGTVRRPGVKYEKERLQSKQTIRLGSGGDDSNKRNDQRKMVMSVDVGHPQNQKGTIEQQQHDVKRQGLMISPDLPANAQPIVSPLGMTQRDADSSAMA